MCVGSQAPQVCCIASLEATPLNLKLRRMGSEAVDEASIRRVFCYTGYHEVLRTVHGF